MVDLHESQLSAGNRRLQRPRLRRFRAPVDDPLCRETGDGRRSRPGGGEPAWHTRRRHGAGNAEYRQTAAPRTANWSLARSWGSLSVQTLSTEYRYDNGAISARAGGHGFGIGSAFKPTEKDTLILQITMGKGLGRYLPTTSWHIASYSAAANLIHLCRSHSYVLGWEPQLDRQGPQQPRLRLYAHRK